MCVPATWPRLQAGGAVQRRFAVMLRGVRARQGGGGGGGEGDGVQAPSGADAHLPGGFLLDFHAPS